MSKLIKSRDEWKSKAVLRANEIREYIKTTKRHQEKIRELKEQLAEVEPADSDKKNHTRNRLLISTRLNKPVYYVFY